MANVNLSFINARKLRKGGETEVSLRSSHRLS